MDTRFKCFPMTTKSYNNCAKGCDKPGIGHSKNDPNNCNLEDVELLCCPCLFSIDTISLPFRFVKWITNKSVVVPN